MGRRLALGLVLLAALLFVFFLFSYRPECAENPDYFEKLTVYDCGSARAPQR
jgi:hypothetical protein